MLSEVVRKTDELANVNSTMHESCLPKWFVMRDLKRSNAKLPAYKQLQNEQFEVFTPLKWHLKTVNGKQISEQVPFIQDLLFVHDTKEKIDLVVDKIPTLQYRFQKGGGYCNPMTVADAEMTRFIHAVNVSEDTKYFLPEDLTPEMIGRRIRVVGGPLNGYEGNLLAIRGAKTKRLLIELSNLFSVGVEVVPEFIQFI